MRKRSTTNPVVRAVQNMGGSPLGPKSMCRCGHTGDGPNSEHANAIALGHGACTQCNCVQFTWQSRIVRAEDLCPQCHERPAQYHGWCDTCRSA